MTEPIETRVARGVEFLNEHVRGWRDVVTTRGFDMGQHACCFQGRLRERHIDLFELCDCDAATLIARGFDVPFAEKRDYPALTAAWKNAVTAPKTRRPAADVEEGATA